MYLYKIVFKIECNGFLRICKQLKRQRLRYTDFWCVIILITLDSTDNWWRMWKLYLTSKLFLRTLFVHLLGFSRFLEREKTERCQSCDIKAQVWAREKKLTFFSCIPINYSHTALISISFPLSACKSLLKPSTPAVWVNLNRFWDKINNDARMISSNCRKALTSSGADHSGA